MLESNYLTQFGYYALGIGVFHSGVEIGDKEYCFGGHDVPNVTGVFVVEPKTGIPELTLKKTIDMGTMDLTEAELEDLLLKLSDEFIGPSYNLLTRNCNHFTEALVQKLTKKPIPAWINRAAKLGSIFPCVVPWEWIQPPEFAEEAEAEAEEEEEETSEDELLSPLRRRSSAISLLSSKPIKSNSTQQQQQQQGNQFPQMTRFQGILFPDEESNNSSKL
ncbi:PPPDE putative peptidase domain-containing protein [Cokeromyces recurvatus]|uniref:PPPDE putative peptidase domain-containing protein n=1 Tax=Cokeromyces recurvatus TaxID=90255 RepID=UPI00221FF7D0|nr:PPPDE putative peptidase domain-containing protein [Cokeromyces recurvatus]KAI7901155.1 PPPDE putative peptidase domain-containing protein [Cokeromyces recurvatus]